MDRHLGGRFRAWALVGAYGDNLTAVADALATDMGLDAATRRQLRLLGEAINYNAYGEAPADQHISPQRLYALMQRHAQPQQLLRDERIGDELDALRHADLQQALAQPLHVLGARARWMQLPDAPWSRRVIGGLANDLASAEPGMAHAVLQDDGRGGYVVSLRAPKNAPGGADAFCRRFGGEATPVRRASTICRKAIASASSPNSASRAGATDPLPGQGGPADPAALEGATFLLRQRRGGRCGFGHRVVHDRRPGLGRQRIDDHRGRGIGSGMQGIILQAAVQMRGQHQRQRRQRGMSARAQQFPCFDAERLAQFLQLVDAG